MDKIIQRFERFAQLRAAVPDIDADEILNRIQDEELEVDEREHLNALGAVDA